MTKTMIAFLLLLAGQAQAQCPNNPEQVTFTYSGVPYTITNVECGSAGNTQYDNLFATTYLNTAFRADGGFDNGNYNCHAFAWANITDEWIATTPTGPNIAPQIYWTTSGMYVTTPNANDAEIAVYGNGSPISNIYPIHSAVHLTNTTTSTNGFAVKYLKQSPQFAGWWISKWEGGPLAIHQLTSCPDYSPGLQITYFRKALDPAGTNFVQAPVYSASAYSIAGPKAVCTSGSQFNLTNVTTGTIIALQANFSVTWSGSSNISFSPGNTAYPVTVSSSASGSGWIQAHITFPDGTSGNVAQYVVWSGVPSYISSISTSQFSQGGIGYEAITVPQSGTDFYAWPFNSGAGDLFPPSGIDSHGASSYNWTCSGLSYNQIPSVEDTRYNSGGFAGTGSATLTVQATNACGTTSQYQALNVTSGGDYVYALSPNPASSQVTVSITKNGSPSVAGAGSQAMSAAPVSGATPSATPVTYNVRVLDLSGMVYYNANQTATKFAIPVGNLKNGNYVVVISDGKTVSSQPLGVSH